MKGSLERVRDVIHGRIPDRPPLYDLLRNDAVIGHFTGETLTVENGAELVFCAYEPAIDATRPLVRAPQREEALTLADGRAERRYRWTTWTDHRRYESSEAYAAAKRKELDAFEPWNAQRAQTMERGLRQIGDNRRRLGEVFFFPGGPGLGLMGLYGEVGLEQFCYYEVDWPDLIDALLEANTAAAVAWLEHLPEGHGLEAVFVGDDIAFKTGPLFSPAWFEEHYFHRMARVCAAHHARGIKVLFHSDGNLNAILPGLVDAGIDGLNPIEVLAGMDLADLHRRYPKLFFAGGIDVSQLLPFGSPREVRDTVRRSIDAAGGRLMVGSSTELNNEVPLENFLAMRDAVLEYTY